MKIYVDESGFTAELPDGTWAAVLVDGATHPTAEQRFAARRDNDGARYIEVAPERVTDMKGTPIS